MSRTVMKIPYEGDKDKIDESIREILINDDYREIDYNREVVWKKGTGLATAMHFIKVEYKTGAIVLSGWIQIGVGSVGGKEQELKGFVGMAPKKSVLKTIKKLQDEIQKNL